MKSRRFSRRKSCRWRRRRGGLPNRSTCACTRRIRASVRCFSVSCGRRGRSFFWRPTKSSSSRRRRNCSRPPMSFSERKPTTRRWTRTGRSERHAGGSGKRNLLGQKTNKFRFPLPPAWRSLRPVRVHLRVVGFLSEKLIGGLLQFLRRRDEELFVGLQKNDLPRRPHETEKQRTLARMRRVQAQVDLFGKPPRRLLQRHDFLRENLRLFIANVDLA